MKENNPNNWAKDMRDKNKLMDLFDLLFDWLPRNSKEENQHNQPSPKKIFFLFSR